MFWNAIMIKHTRVGFQRAGEEPHECLCYPNIISEKRNSTELSKQRRRSHGGSGGTAPVAQTLRGQHGGNRLPFFPELHHKICALFTEIRI